jgi:hypothetical protein
MEHTEDFTFYHGTGSIAAKAILVSSSNDSLFEEIGAFELGRQIYRALSKYADFGSALGFYSVFSGLPHALLCKLALQDLDGNNDRSHFKYGHFFVTLNIANAYRYAIANPYRSEFMFALAESLNVLKAKGDSLVSKVPVEFPEVARAIENPPPPVVLELKGIARGRLTTAKGDKDIEPEIETFKTMQCFDGVNVPADFRIRTVTSSDIVAIHDLRDWPAEEPNNTFWRPDSSKVAAVRFGVRDWLLKEETS